MASRGVMTLFICGSLRNLRPLAIWAGWAVLRAGRNRTLFLRMVGNLAGQMPVDDSHRNIILQVTK